MQPFFVKHHVNIRPNALVTSIKIDARNNFITPELPPLCVVTMIYIN
jgi:hypothetical protein